MNELRVVVFGSKNLGAQHLEAMVDALAEVARTVPQETKLVLVHGDDAPGVGPGAIGAPRLAEVAARLAWKGRNRGLRRWHLKREKDGDKAEEARNQRMARGTHKPYRALCFHTSDSFEQNPGSGAADLARAIRREGVGYTLVVLGNAGEQLRTEQRGTQS